MTLGISITQHNNALHYAECIYAECRVLFIVMLNVGMLSVVVPFIRMFEIRKMWNFINKFFPHLKK
jgi:hypothetical protein